MSSPNHRHSIRLPGYDYASEGAYFVTLLVHQREPLFGSLANGEVQLTTWGRLVESEWRRLPMRFNGIQIDTHMIMPDHLHGILWIQNTVMSSPQGARHHLPLKINAPSLASPLPGLHHPARVCYNSPCRRGIPPPVARQI